MPWGWKPAMHVALGHNGYGEAGEWKDGEKEARDQRDMEDERKRRSRRRHEVWAKGGGRRVMGGG